MMSYVAGGPACLLYRCVTVSLCSNGLGLRHSLVHNVGLIGTELLFPGDDQM